MASALAAHGVPYEFVSRPEWEHGFDGAGLKDEALAAAYESIDRFLELHLKQ